MPETARSRFLRWTNLALAPTGVQLTRSDRHFDLDGLLARARRRGLRPATVIDVGASDGIWSLRACRHFADARYLLFEPLREHEAALGRLASEHGFLVERAAAGACPGEADFTVDPGLDGSGIAGVASGSTRRVPVDSIDAAVQRHGLGGPYLLKLDTHGHEIPVLEGARRVMSQTGLAIVEAYNFTLQPGCPRFHELCAWMDLAGFRCCDLCDPLRRPGDGVFWQFDLAFAPADAPYFASNAYR